MNALSIPLPVTVRQRGEIVGIVAGIVCFPVALYVGAMEGLFPNGPAALVLPIVILTALAGAIASLTADESKAPDVLPQRPRLQIPCGLRELNQPMPICSLSIVHQTGARPEQVIKAFLMVIVGLAHFLWHLLMES